MYASSIGLKVGQPKANRQKLQAAIDNLAKNQKSEQTIIFGNNQRYDFDRPIWLANGVSLEGNRGTNELHFPSGTGLIMGIPRAPGGVKLDSSFFPDAFGKLDTTAAPTPGVRHGIRWQNKAKLMSMHSPFNMGKGEYWKGKQQLTIEFVLDATGTDEKCGTAIGMSGGGKASPYSVLWGSDPSAGFLLCLGLVDEKDAFVNWNHRFVGMSLTSIHRIVFQVDLVRGEIGLWIDNKKVPEAVVIGPDLYKFVANRDIPFHCNASTFSGSNWGTDYFTLPENLDSGLFGLCVRDQAVYKWQDTLERIDGQSINDANQFFNQNDPSVCGLIMFNEDASEVAADRVLKFYGGTSTGYAASDGLILSPEHGDIFKTTSGNHTVSGMGINAATDAMLWGTVLYSLVDECNLWGWGYGIGTPNWSANYTNRITNSQVEGQDCNIYNYYGILYIKNLFAWTSGRSCLRFSVARARVDGVFGVYGIPEQFVLVNGGDVLLNDVSFDIENRQGPTECGILAIPNSGAGNSIACRVEITDFNIAAFQLDVPLVRLQSGNGNGYCKLVDPYQSGIDLAPMKALISVEKKDDWEIELHNHCLPKVWTEVLEG